MKSYLIFDLGGTFVKYSVSDEEGNLAGTGAFSTPHDNLQSMLQKMREIYMESEFYTKISGIAISSPGAVDCAAGVVGGISAIPYIHKIPLTARISEFLGGLPVSIENDANCAALGELWKGAAQGSRNIASVVCGTGIGGAVVIDGKLNKGTSNNGGEFGNYLVKKEEERYRTWSAYTIVKQAEKYCAITGTTVDGKKLFQLASKGDDTAKMLVDQFYETMAVGFYNIQFTLDTELIVFGGGVSEAPFVIPEIEKRMDRMAEKERFGFLKPRIVPCRFGNKANLYGALYHYLKSEISI